METFFIYDILYIVMVMKDIFKKFGIKFKTEKLIRTALTHTSYVNEHGGESYERLEFLGDAVLEIVCSDYLYTQTKCDEGQMTRLRKLYVCENALYEFSKEVNLKDYILMGNAMKEANKTIIADVFEACIAVIYLENGLSTVKRLFRNLIVPYIEREEDFLMDYKSLLQESVQTGKRSVEYKIIEESGPAHKKEFKAEVIIDGLVYGIGVGDSKKEAEQNAAKEALKKKA